MYSHAIIIKEKDSGYESGRHGRCSRKGSREGLERGKERIMCYSILVKIFLKN